MKKTGMIKNQNRKDKPFFQQTEPQRVIDFCLSCQWDVCWDCLGKKNEYSLALQKELKEVLDD